MENNKARSLRDREVRIYNTLREHTVPELRMSPTPGELEKLTIKTCAILYSSIEAFDKIVFNNNK